MNRFIRKTLALGVVPLVLIFVTVLIYKYKVNNIRLDDTVRVLILGDSHTQSGMDDNRIRNALNISQSSEHFLYSYNVLKLLLHNNAQIEKVILGVSFHSFSESYDEYIHADDKTIHMFPKYFPILDLESISEIHELPSAELKDILKNMVKGLINTTEVSSFSFAGSFYKSAISNLNDSTVNAAIQRHYLTDAGEVQSYSEYQVKYLNKIIDLCNSKHVELIIINTPVHKAYYNRIPENFISNYYLTIQLFGDDVRFWDYYTVDFPGIYFGDGDHLNAMGAERFSSIINERMDEVY